MKSTANCARWALPVTAAQLNELVLALGQRLKPSLCPDFEQAPGIEEPVLDRFEAGH